MIKLKLYGLGGQGVVTAAKILSKAVSIYEDKYAVTIPAYGHERRGAPVYTDIVVDDDKVLLNCFVYEPDIVLVMDETIIEKNVDVGKGINKNTVLVINTDKADVLEKYKSDYGFEKVFYVDGTKMALKNIGAGIPNGAMLGALAKTGLVKIESIEQALIESFGEKAGDMNAKAARDSYEYTKEL